SAAGGAGGGGLGKSMAAAWPGKGWRRKPAKRSSTVKLAVGRAVGYQRQTE
ncbi:MAG: hypothetical protein RL490_2456, partial [Pseudomonadota bacterium]